MTPKKGGLYIDRSGKVWKASDVTQRGVTARCRGVKRYCGLGTWKEQYEPFTDEMLDEMLRYAV